MKRIVRLGADIRRDVVAKGPASREKTSRSEVSDDEQDIRHHRTHAHENADGARLDPSRRLCIRYQPVEHVLET